MTKGEVRIRRKIIEDKIENLEKLKKRAMEVYDKAIEDQRKKLYELRLQCDHADNRKMGANFLCVDCGLIV